MHSCELHARHSCACIFPFMLGRGGDISPGEGCMPGTPCLWRTLDVAGSVTTMAVIYSFWEKMAAATLAWQKLIWYDMVACQALLRFFLTSGNGLYQSLGNTLAIKVDLQ